MNRLVIDIESKTFPQNLTVLEQVKFSVSLGEFVAIVGPSGAGKTTLLNIIAGIDRNYKGQVRTVSDNVNKPDELNIGFMFQQTRLMPWLTVLENIMLVINPGQRINKQAPEKENRFDIAKQMIEQVGLKGFESSYPHQLSGGMQKRVSLARAFAVDPQLLLLDEPFQSLDAPTANKFRDQLMTMWNQRKQTVLFVTHDLREAISLADRIIFFTNRPSKIVLDYSVKLERPRMIDSADVSASYEALLSHYPEILSGRL